MCYRLPVPGGGMEKTFFLKILALSIICHVVILFSGTQMRVKTKEGSAEMVEMVLPREQGTVAGGQGTVPI